MPRPAPLGRVLRPRRKPFDVQLLYLIQGQNYVTMSDKSNPAVSDQVRASGNPDPDAPLYYRSRMKVYPMGGREIMYSTKPIFTPGSTGKGSDRKKKKTDKSDGLSDKPCSDAAKSSTAKDIDPLSAGEPNAANFDRSRRRARAKVRDLALSNRFAWFVTLTLDPAKVNRYDLSSFQRVLTRWLDNAVRRRGLQYILVPERHKDGAIHFHGFFSDAAMDMVSSGHTDAAGHPVFNCQAWPYGFTACIRIYGNYAQAVSYVCKYIGKQGEKPGGRWYYSGGGLQQPQIVYGILDNWDDGQSVAGAFGPLDAEAYTFTVPEAGFQVGIIRQNM